jgi:tol-pal system protein YbgF
MNMKGVLIVSMLGMFVFTGTVFGASDAQEQRLQRLERRVGHITELMLEVQSLKRTNRELQGQVEELQHTLERMRRKQRELYLDLDERMARLSGNDTPVNAIPVPVASVARSDNVNTTGNDAGNGTESANPAQEQADYDAAYAWLSPSNRRYKDAVAGFKLFLQKYPNSELADNALYWLGESYYVTQDNKFALAAFDRLLKEFPQSDKAPGAMLKKGYILDAMGQRKQARQILQKVLDTYPSSSVASMAKARLKHMSK